MSFVCSFYRHSSHSQAFYARSFDRTLKSNQSLSQFIKSLANKYLSSTGLPTLGRPTQITWINYHLKSFTLTLCCCWWGCPASKKFSLCLAKSKGNDKITSLCVHVALCLQSLTIQLNVIASYSFYHPSFYWKSMKPPPPSQTWIFSVWLKRCW